MTGITTIHQTLGNVDADSGGVDSIVYIRYRAHWSAVDTHAHRQIGMMF